MKAFIAVALISATAGQVAAQARGDSAGTAARQLFAAVSGKWSCEGGFPNGRVLAADLRMESVLDGRSLSAEHLDRAPGSYWQRMSWALDGRRGVLLGVGVAGSTKDQNAAVVSWTARDWKSDGVIFETDSSKAPVNRYAYTLQSDGTLKYGWYIRAADRWVLGDSLICRR